MLKINTSFHLTHMIRNLQETRSVYDRLFQCPVRDLGYHEGEHRDAAFAYVSDVNIELFASRDVDDETPRSNGGKFVRRWGEGLANFGWLIEDNVKDAIRFCEAEGLSPAYVAGPSQSAFFFHPRQAFGMMLEVAHGRLRPDDPRSADGWKQQWLDHPLGIERLSFVTFAVRDIDGPVHFLQQLTGAPLLHRGMAEDRGDEVAYLWMEDHIIEIAKGVSDTSPLGGMVSARGPKIYSATFKVRDVEKAADHVERAGLRYSRTAAGDVAVEPADIFGANYLFSERSVPGDPRA